MSAGLESVSVEPTTVIDLILTAAVNSIVMISCGQHPCAMSCYVHGTGQVQLSAAASQYLGAHALASVLVRQHRSRETVPRQACDTSLCRA